MNNLEIYDLYGFKFFLCKADKSPDTPGFFIDKDPRCWDEKEKKYKTNFDWKQLENHITREQAEAFQKTGRMIGAWIPENVVVIDLDRHEGKENGVKTMEGIKREYKIEYSVTDNTFLVMTSGNGFHVFYTTDKEFKQNTKAPGIDLKTHKGYVIAAGSPGYKVINEYEPEPLPLELEQWLFDCDKREEKPKPEKGKEKKKENSERKKLPPKSLKTILNKVDVSHFSDNDRWLEFVMACLAVAGNNSETQNIIDEWSKSDPAYSSDKSVVKRIQSFDEIKEITTGTFIHFLREENISQYIINQVVKLDSISSTLIDAENSEIDLPFDDPEYQKLSEISAAHEFFHMQGNTSAATILNVALENKVLYNDTEKICYYFDGNRWIEFQDFYGIIYTIIYRVLKILYANTEGTKEDNDRMFKCVASINTTKWKQMTWTEFCYKELIYRKSVPWDSPKIKETITTINSVIDFTSKEMKIRKGNYSEYRRAYFEYATEEIIEAGKPEIFLEFFDSLFPDEETRRTAMYCISMSISGNAGKRLFQLWQGIGSNGKSTLLETIKHVLGPEKSYKFPAQILLKDSKHENYKSEIAKFQGKYFCYTSEASKGIRLSQNVIKDMTGDEAISARELYKNPVEFEATWQIIYAVNELPPFYGDDYAFIDRLIVIPFKMFFYKNEEKKEKALSRGIIEKNMKKADNSIKFKNSLWSERAGIIKWMIDNYNNLNTNIEGVIPESPECIIKKNTYVDDNDDVGIFIKELCEIDTTEKKGWYVIPDEIAEVYKEFTGETKKGNKSIKRDIKNSHSAIQDSVIRITIKDDYANIEKKQVRILKNIILKDNKEIFEATKKREDAREEKEFEQQTIDDLSDDDLNEEIPF